ncbi:MAG: hypothetical protein Q8L57_03290, partial [bacterium]|nr:hypothetical protein [bacterium]
MFPEINFLKELGEIGKIFLSLWWLYLPPVLFFISADLWVLYLKIKTISKIKWQLLEIKIPKDIQKTPKAMEQVFSGLHGIHVWMFTFADKYLKGKIQEWFSFEIVGINGDIYFFVYTPAQFRNLVEAQIYAQYPAAEINEASDDYTGRIPEDVPGRDYDLWGTELILIKPDPYPIRTYEYWEAIPEEQRLDPLASLTEVLSKLKQGEQIWIQFLIKPTGMKWVEEGKALVDELIGKRPKAKYSFWGRFAIVPEFLRNLIWAPFMEPVWTEGKKEGEREAPPSLISFLSPGAKEVVEAVEKDIAKLGFDAAVRFLYLARKDIFSRVNVAAIMGCFKQFNTQNLNGFMPNISVSTSVRYPFFKKKREYLRKRRLLMRYKFRVPASKFFVLNIEELAT